METFYNFGKTTTGKLSLLSLSAAKINKVALSCTADDLPEDAVFFIRKTKRTYKTPKGFLRAVDQLHLK